MSEQLPPSLRLIPNDLDVELSPSRGWHDVDSLYVETFWLPRLGPSAFVLLRRLARLVEPAQSIGHADVDTLYLARSVGIGGKLGPNATLASTLRRLERFECVSIKALPIVLVRTQLPQLPPHEICNLPPVLRSLHRQVEQERHAAK